MPNAAVLGLKFQIHNRSNAITIAIEQIRVHQGGQTLQSGLIGDRRFTAHEHLLIRETTALIQTPHIPAEAQGRRTTDPAQEAMNRWVHPGHDTGSMVKTQITANGMAQQITEQKLLRKGHLRNGSEQASPDT